MSIPASPRCPPECPQCPHYVPLLGARHPSRELVPAPLAVPGARPPRQERRTGEPRESYYRSPSGSPRLLSRLLVSQIQQIQHFPGPGQPLAPPWRCLRGRRGPRRSFPFDEEQTRTGARSAAGSNRRGLKPRVLWGESPPRYPPAGLPTRASLRHGGDTQSIPTGRLSAPPRLPGSAPSSLGLGLGFFFPPTPFSPFSTSLFPRLS